MTLKQLNRFLTKIVAEGQTADLIFAKHSYFRLHGETERQILVYHLDDLIDIYKTKCESVFEFLQKDVKLEDRTLQLINLDSHIIVI